MMKSKGFTLLELMIVVIVIGVLAALALPRFNRAVERGRQSEALSNLGSLRQSTFRWFAEFPGVYPTLDQLDVENPMTAYTVDERYFDYSAPVGAGGDFTITATRNATRRPAGVGAYTITINQDGVITSTF